MSNARALVAIASLTAVSCSIPPRTPVPPGLHSPYTGYSSAVYRDDKLWLCRPDLPGAPCNGDLTATELGADGSRTVVSFAAATNSQIDCFYVYPTVDLSLLPGNHTDLDDRAAIIQTTLAQAARFREVCNLYVPLYRQITIGAYVFGGKDQAKRLDVAFSDVEDAFLHYMGQYNHGHRIVLIGHSQGSEMVMRLLRSRFDRDPLLRGRLLAALAIGGSVETTGGHAEASLANIPLCSSPDQFGCVIGYHSYRADKPVGDWPWKDPSGQTSACANPAALGSAGAHPFSASYFPTRGDLGRYLHVDGITTPFVVVRDFYSGACVTDGDGHSYLTVAPSGDPNDRRQGLVDLGTWTLNTGFGFHVLDMTFPLGDLVEDVRHKARVVAASAAVLRNP